MGQAIKIAPEGIAYRSEPRDRIILEFNRPIRTVLERFQRDDGGWDLKVTVFEIDDNSWDEKSESIDQVMRSDPEAKESSRER
jgi:hypothetical protein